jgi:hypothetical protein
MADPVKIERAELERRWRTEMKQLGVNTIRTRFIQRMLVTDTMPYPEHAFIQAWLEKQERKARLRADVMRAIVVVGVIAACIAAWPTVRDWLR